MARGDLSDDIKGKFFSPSLPPMNAKGTIFISFCCSLITEDAQGEDEMIRKCSKLNKRNKKLPNKTSWNLFKDYTFVDNLLLYILTSIWMLHISNTGQNLIIFYIFLLILQMLVDTKTLENWYFSFLDGHYILEVTVVRQNFVKKYIQLWYKCKILFS